MISSCCMWKKWTYFELIWDFFPKKGGVTLSQILSESDQANFGYFCEKQKCSLHAKRSNKHQLFCLLFGVPNRGEGSPNLGKLPKFVRVFLYDGTP